MANIEASLLERLFDTNVPLRRAIFCTYRFDPDYFTDAILPELNRCGCERALILMDASQYQTLHAPEIPGALGQIVLERFPSGKLFHPKVFVLTGSGRARCVIGSANLTRAGLEMNKELFSLASENDFDLSRLNEWLEQLSEHNLGRNARQIIQETIAELRASQLGLPKQLSLPFVVQGLKSPSLWQQLNSAIGGKIPQRAIVLSPYFESPETFADGLITSWLKERVRVDLYLSLDHIYSKVPRDALVSLQRRYPNHLYIFGMPTGNSLPHGKLLAAMTRSQGWLLTGSANFTQAGLKGRNIETGLLLNYPRVELERYLKRLLVNARSLDPSDLPPPMQVDLSVPNTNTGFLVEAMLSIRENLLTLKLNCPWQELTPTLEDLQIHVGVHSVIVLPSMVADECTITLRPVSPFLQLNDGTWQVGSIMLCTQDGLAEDWRLIELVEDEQFNSYAGISIDNADLDSFVMRLFNPRLKTGQRQGPRRIPKNGANSSPTFVTEDIEGDLDAIYRLTSRLETYFSHLMTDPYTIHRWRKMWLQLYGHFSEDRDNYSQIARSFLASRLLQLFESFLAKYPQEKNWLYDDDQFLSSLQGFREATVGSVKLKIPLIDKCLAEIKL